MKKFLWKVFFILLWIWHLPQNIVAMFRILLRRIETSWLKPDNPHEKGGSVSTYISEACDSVTLGEYIFVYHKLSNREEVIQHETGHVIQSRILGPLYLIVIGIYSGIWCLFGANEKGRYACWTERWANRLSGLKVDDYGNPV